ncbi:hypothetical protein [Neorhizobium galegae]|uniref:hypothetical protein n=1 Tax=Neorhizobium galegae TaxID=399 RepID=UPI00155F32AF|nr:hypothetical protein [Neorhizobium galegae]
MSKSAFFAVIFFISTQATAQMDDRYEFHARNTQLIDRVWWVHGVAIDNQQNKTWWCVYYVNIRTIITKLECLRRQIPSTDIDPSWSGGMGMALASRNTYPPKIAWSLDPYAGNLEACLLVTKLSCKAVQLGSSPRLLESSLPSPFRIWR